jgi:hypothetical protein
MKVGEIFEDHLRRHWSSIQRLSWQDFWCILRATCDDPKATNSSRCTHCFCSRRQVISWRKLKAQCLKDKFHYLSTWLSDIYNHMTDCIIWTKWCHCVIAAVCGASNQQYGFTGLPGQSLNRRSMSTKMVLKDFSNFHVPLTMTQCVTQHFLCLI